MSGAYPCGPTSYPTNTIRMLPEVPPTYVTTTTSNRGKDKDTTCGLKTTCFYALICILATLVLVILGCVTMIILFLVSPGLIPVAAPLTIDPNTGALTTGTGTGLLTAGDETQIRRSIVQSFIVTGDPQSLMRGVYDPTDKVSMYVGNGATELNGPLYVTNGDAHIDKDLYVHGLLITPSQSTPSDPSLKKDMKDLCLDMKQWRYGDIQPISFRYLSDLDDILHFGFNATQIQELFPNLVHLDEKTNTLSIRTSEFIPMLFCENKHLREKLSDMENRLMKLESRYDKVAYCVKPHSSRSRSRIDADETCHLRVELLR